MIYLLRHGQTRWNTEGRKQGQGNSPLTETGISQIQACAKKLAELIKGQDNIEIYVSPLKRTKETYQHIRAYLHKPFQIFYEEALMELDYGQWEGLTNEQVDLRFPGERKRRNKDRWNYVIPGGESYAMVAHRVTDWMGKTIRGQTTIVITHEMVSRVIRGIYLGSSREEMLTLNHPHTSIFILDHGAIKECRTQSKT